MFWTNFTDIATSIWTLTTEIVTTGGLWPTRWEFWDYMTSKLWQLKFVTFASLFVCDFTEGSWLSRASIYLMVLLKRGRGENYCRLASCSVSVSRGFGDVGQPRLFCDSCRKLCSNGLWVSLFSLSCRLVWTTKCGRDDVICDKPINFDWFFIVYCSAVHPPRAARWFRVAHPSW